MYLRCDGDGVVVGVFVDMLRVNNEVKKPP